MLQTIYLLIFLNDENELKHVKIDSYSKSIDFSFKKNISFNIQKILLRYNIVYNAIQLLVQCSLILRN